jgi:signal transduction histidine kinase
VRTSVQYIGPLSVVDATLADHAEAVVREAVNNAVRHANSTALTVTISVDDDLTIEVKDNGRGMPADITGSGLTNLRRRAEDVGGSFSVLAPPDGGTHLIWRAPLP